MAEASIINIGISVGTIVFSVGGVWGLIRSNLKEHADKIISLERSRGKMYDELKDQGENIASINAKVDILLQRRE